MLNPVDSIKYNEITKTNKTLSKRKLESLKFRLNRNKILKN